MAEPVSTPSPVGIATSPATETSPRSSDGAPEGIEAEDDDYDSTYETDAGGSSTTSIGSSVLKYREENGRTYHAYKVYINLEFQSPSDD